MGLRSRKPRRTILVTNLLLRLAKSKRKRTFAQSLTITEPRNFLRLELEISGEEMGLEKRVFKKNNLIRPGNRKTRMLFYQEKRNWTKEDWKKLLSSDETKYKKDKNDIFTLYWPPQSPDRNIIGSIWHMITRKLHKNTKFIKSEQNIIGCFLA